MAFPKLDDAKKIKSILKQNGYDGILACNSASQVIMAAGAFVSGSSIELSADGPLREPYTVFFQGGLTWNHARFGILRSLQSLVDKGIVKKSDLC